LSGENCVANDNCFAKRSIRAAYVLRDFLLIESIKLAMNIFTERRKV
jgi:hypothetical protein